MLTLIVWLAKNIVGPTLNWVKDSFIGQVLSWILGLVKKAINWYFGILVVILGYFAKELFYMIKTFWVWVIDQSWQLWGEIGQWLITQLPEQSQPDISALTTVINSVNAWVPLDLGVTLLNLWIDFALLWAGWFIVKRHIPTLGK